MKRLYIGLDVHKEKTVIAIAFCDRGEVVVYGKCSSDIRILVKTIRRILKKYEVEKKGVSICYEAGPCGFAIVRHLLRLGFDTIVVSPAHVPVVKGNRVKTDVRVHPLAGSLIPYRLAAVPASRGETTGYDSFLLQFPILLF